MRAIRLAFVLVALALLLSLAAPAHAARPCNQYPSFIQPIACKILEKLP